MRKLSNHDVAVLPHTGIDSVSRKEKDLLDLPDHEQVPPSRLNFHENLEKIFPVKNSDSFFVNQTIPIPVFKTFQNASQMYSMLPDLRRSLKLMASEQPDLARKIGGVSKILDDKKQLLELLQLYRSALFQG